MTGAELYEPLDVAVSEAASAMAFVEAMPIEADAEAGSVAVALELIAPLTARLCFRMQASDARAISESAWGALASGSDEQAHQFLSEFANVVAGRLLADLYPGQEVRIGLPEVLAAGPAAGAARRLYDLDGWRLSVELQDAA